MDYNVYPGYLIPLKKESESKGKAEEIIETGYEFGMSESDILDRLQKKLDVSLQKAQKYFKIFKNKPYNI